MLELGPGKTVTGIEGWIDLSPDGRRAVSCNTTGQFRLSSLPAGDSIWSLESKFNCAAWSLDGRNLLTAEWGALQYWDLHGGRLVFEADISGWTLDGCPLALALSPSKRLALIGGLDYDGDLFLCNVAAPHCRWPSQDLEYEATLKGHSDTVNAIAFSPDGRLAVSAADDQTLRLWHVKSARQLQELRGHTGPVTTAEFSPDGRFILSGSTDGTLRIWRVQSSEAIHVLECHSGAVRALALSPDGQFVVSGSDSSEIRVWDLRDGQCRYTATASGKPIRQVAWSADPAVVAAESHGPISIWPLPNAITHLDGSMHGAHSTSLKYLEDSSKYRIRCEREVFFETSFRDVEWVDDQTLLCMMPTADIARIDLGDIDARPQTLVPAGDILAPVAEALGTDSVKPAEGGYPRLAISPRSGLIAVNTHDAVVVMCHADRRDVPELISFSWGEYYYPRIDFSPDGSRFSMEDYVYDTSTWKWSKHYSRTYAWHPTLPCRLGFDGSGSSSEVQELGWLDWSDLDHPRFIALSAIRLPLFGPLRIPIPPSNIILNPTASVCVVSCRDPSRIEWWQLDPFKLIDSREIPQGGACELRGGADTPLFGVVTDDGVQVWDFDTREPVSELILGATGIRFSRSGTRYLTFDLPQGSTNPYPVLSESHEQAFRGPDWYSAVIWDVTSRDSFDGTQ